MLSRRRCRGDLPLSHRGRNTVVAIAATTAGPFRNPPAFEKLIGDLKGAFSRRIYIQHPLVYQVLEAEKVVKILRLWSHYEWPLLSEGGNPAFRQTKPAQGSGFERTDRFTDVGT